MSLPSKSFVLTAFALVMSALPAFSQTNMQFVQGIVTDADGKVVVGAVIALDTDEAAKGVYVGVDGVADVGHTEGKKHSEAKSDKKGHYIINMLP